MKMLFREDIAEEFFWHVRKNYRSYTEAALKYGCHQSFISRVISGKAMPTAVMLEDRGYTKKTVFFKEEHLL